MTEPSILRAAQLETLLDAAYELDEAARRAFIETVDPEFREELCELLQAMGSTGPMDRSSAGFASALMQDPTLSDAMSVGERIGHYRLIRLLGEGGMASVWLAERDDGTFSHQVAVKCLKTGLGTPESRNRFLREQQILAQLQHPNIARLYDAGISNDGVPFIVMEWIDGLSLIRHCDDKRLSVRQRLDLFQKMCNAVAYAHQNLIVHRDIKPGNILVGADGEPKLLDFGIAKLLDESEPMTRSGLHLLTPEYAAPEQFSGNAITTATDVYALGGVLYELLCGIKPRHFVRNRSEPTGTVTAPSEALRRIKPTLDPKQLAEPRLNTTERLQKTLRGDLDTIVMKALQVESSRRYPTVQTFSEDIDRYLKQQPIHARKDAWSYRFRKFLQRHALATALTTVTVVALFAATGISIFQARRAEAESQRALAVKDFLTNLFEVSDSGLPREQVPTTQALLEDGAKRIRTEFNNTPELKLDLLLLIGKVQSNLGLYDSAEILLKEARELAETTLKPNSETWLRSQTEWADFLCKKGRYTEAEQQLTLAIANYRSAGATDSASLATALRFLAQATKYRNLDKAIVLSREALTMSKRLSGEHSVEVRLALQSLGNVLSGARQPEEAESVLRANMALSRKLYGEQNAHFAVALSELVDVLAENGKYAEAEQFARQALAIAEAVYPRSNSQFINILMNLGKALAMNGKYSDAEIVFKRAEAMQMELAPDNTLPMLSALGNVAIHNRRFLEAEQLNRRVLEGYRKKLGLVNPPVATILFNLASTLSGQKRYQEAITALREALDIRQKLYGRNNQVVGKTINALADAENAMGRAQQALQHIEDALQGLQDFDPGHPTLVEAEIIKGEVLFNLKRYQEAKEWYLPVIARMRQNESFDQFQMRDGLITLGKAQLALGEAENALASWNEALKLVRSMDAPSSTANIDLLKHLIASASKRSTVKAR